ncbi:hypothetical protein N0V90_003323 [Kalmusia sp. IMI 367209]|nr:hypothetical protein N0V90_003323 [Kalmusia sp. IMI 367209]
MSSPPTDNASSPAAGEQPVPNRYSQARNHVPAMVPRIRVPSPDNSPALPKSWTSLSAPGSNPNTCTPPHTRPVSADAMPTYSKHIRSTSVRSAYSTNSALVFAPQPGAIGSERAAGLPLPPSPRPLRRVLAAPLQVLRSICANMKPYKDFIDRVCPSNEQESTEHDRFLTSIEVAYKFPMSHEDWEVFQKLLERFSLVCGAHDMLNEGAAAFDHINDNLPAVELLESGNPLDQVITYLSTQYSLGLKYDSARPWAH